MQDCPAAQDAGGGDRLGQERFGELLEDGGEIADAEAVAALALRQQETKPAELGHLAPASAVEIDLLLGAGAQGTEILGAGGEIGGALAQQDALFALAGLGRTHLRPPCAAAISASLMPSSPRIALVCSPSRGARLRTRPGLSEKAIATPLI